MEAIGTIIFVVLFVLYLLFLIPAFMFTWEGDGLDGIGCYGWVCMIVGFPGVIIALIAKAIKNSFEKKQSLPIDVINHGNNTKEKEKERIENEKRQKVYNDWYLRLKNSKIANDVINELMAFYEKNNTYPNIIKIYTDKVIGSYKGAVVINYVYEHHNIKNLPEIRNIFSYANDDNWSSVIREDVDTLSILARVINESVNNVYNISTKTRREQHKADLVTNIDTVTEYAQLDMLNDI